MKAAVVSTFPNNCWKVYAEEMIKSYVANFPAEIPLLIQLDDDLLFHDVGKLLRPQDAIACGWEDDHKAFVERNKEKDDPNNYRKQAVRFCHKVFAITRAMDAVQRQKDAGGEDYPRYLIWMDADVIINRTVTIDEIKECLPKEGDAVSYLGRKDWDHSECGWLAFDLENEGWKLINGLVGFYLDDSVFGKSQWHDSYMFDQLEGNKTNLTYNKPGMDIWPQSPMGKWSTHYKGPVAKQKRVNPKTHQTGNIVIQTKNALPNEDLHEHIRKNQELIKNWIQPCAKIDEEIVIVSAGPQLIAEDLRFEAGKKIVAVKHAIEPLRKAGIKPWACILLDPRPHVANFVTDADTDILWFVASQVNPEVTKQLLAKGCTVWGYHASIAAEEGFLTILQRQAIVGGGSATATRGLYVLNHLGFSNFRLYGYDLCFPDKPDLEAKDDMGQPKYLEISLGMNDPLFNLKRCFWSEPQLIAQFEEISDIIKRKIFKIEALGDGIVPFIIKSQKVSDLRNNEIRAKIAGDNPPTCNELIYGKKPDSRPVCSISQPKPATKSRRAKRITATRTSRSGPIRSIRS